MSKFGDPEVANSLIKLADEHCLLHGLNKKAFARVLNVTRNTLYRIRGNDTISENIWDRLAREIGVTTPQDAITKAQQLPQPLDISAQDFKQAFGMKLCQWLRKNHITNPDFVKKIQVSNSQLSRMLSGKGYVGIDHFHAASLAMGYSCSRDVYEAGRTLSLLVIPNEFNRTDFGAAVRNARIAERHTLSEHEEFAGVPKRTLMRVEKGDPVNANTIRTILERHGFTSLEEMIAYHSSTTHAEAPPSSWTERISTSPASPRTRSS